MTDLPAPPPPSPPSEAPGQRVNQGAPTPVSSGTNGLAIASLVLGIVWLGGLGSLLAVIFGRQAKAQIRQTGEQGEGLATAGFVLGVIGLVLVGLTVGLIMLVQILGENATTNFSRTGSAIN